MSVNIQTFRDIRIYIAKELEKLYQEPEIIAITNIIIKTVYGTSKLHELYSDDRELTDAQNERIISICRELTTGRPIQYILGETTFYDCIIRVNGATLIPRQETEELVDLVIRENRDRHVKIIDIGTGSGCIAVALAANLSASEVTAIEISAEAIATARENALLNNVSVTFLQGDILSSELSLSGKYDIIVSNPPYVRDSEKILMTGNVLGFEPHPALFVDDSDPLIYYREILRLGDKVLAKNGLVYFEINEAMGGEMLKLLGAWGYKAVEIVKDLNGKNRIAKGRKDG